MNKCWPWLQSRLMMNTKYTEYTEYKVESRPSESNPVAISSHAAFLAYLLLKSGCALSYRSGYCSIYSSRWHFQRKSSSSSSGGTSTSSTSCSCSGGPASDKLAASKASSSRGAKAGSRPGSTFSLFFPPPPGFGWAFATDLPLPLGAGVEVSLGAST